MENSLTAWAQEMAAIAERKTRAQDKRQNTSHLSQIQAEAERERRAKVINAEGEFQAAQQLVNAALIIEQHPVALQLRYLQTLTEVATENNSTTLFPVPIDLLSPFLHRS